LPQGSLERHPPKEAHEQCKVEGDGDGDGDGDGAGEGEGEPGQRALLGQDSHVT